MYKVSLFNNGVETVVHYPSANQEDPHVNKLPLKEGLSVVDSLSFSLYPTSPGYSNLFELVTKVKVVDVRDNTIRFTGRVFEVNEKMDNDGGVYKEVSCEGALSYLNDTKQRGSSFYATSVYDFLVQILTIHNSKVDAGKKIYVGSVNVAGAVLHRCDYKTTLAEILLVRETMGGQIRIREVNNVLYLDWLTSFNSNTLEVSLGVNMKDMVRSKDVSSLGTRIIPLGANNLTIESVNGGIDYIEDVTAKNTYGVIEKTVEYKDIEDATTLKNTCIADISNYTQPVYVLESSALDLSFLTNNKAEQFVLGTQLHLINKFMGVDATYTIVKMDLDLLLPYDPKLTIANKVTTLTDAINDLRTSSLQNNGVYNNVQIGSSYGIRAVRSDNKVVTTLNATEGISIENTNKKVFSVDLNGNIVVNDGTFNNITANDINANGGTFNDISASGGTFDDISASGGTFDSITATNGLTIEDGSVSCSIDSTGIQLVGSNASIAKIEILDDGSYDGTYIRDDLYVEDILRVFGDAKFQNGFHCYDNAIIDYDLEIDGTLYIGDRTLEEYIRYVMS